jgi:capsular polysaccharide biosynthesis protein
MPNDLNQGAVRISHRIYGRLLLAYPKGHRQAYGAAMAQLFRNQCRDAWEGEQGWGLVKLWLRVLPDLVCTAITERIAALKERKSMSDKIASMSNFRAVSTFATFTMVMVTVFLVVLATSIVITFILPETYASTARMVVEDPSASGPTYDPYFLQTEFEIIHSQVVLTQVIDKLNLKVAWGKKYNNGQALDTIETLKVLQQRFTLNTIRNTKYIELTAYSEDPNEAAQLANGVAEAYQNYHSQLETSNKRKAFELMQARAKQQESQMQLAQTDVDSLRQKFNIPSNAVASQSPQEQAYWDKKRDLDQLIELHKTLTTNIKAFYLVISDPPVIFTDAAEPSRIPAKPNKTLNIVVGAIAGIFWGTMAGIIAVTVNHLLKRRLGIALVKP